MKKAMLAVLLFLVGWTAVCAAGDQAFETKEQAKLVFDQFMQHISADKVAEAFALIEPYFPLSGSEISAMKVQIVQRRDLIKPRFGRSLGYEFFGEKAVKDFLVQYTYIERFERHAIRWIVVAYKPKDRWFVNSVFFDDQIQELLE